MHLFSFTLGLRFVVSYPFSLTSKLRSLCPILSTQIALFYPLRGPSLVAQSVKDMPVVQETRVRSLGWEDPLEKEMATHSRILAWTIPWTEEPGGLQSMGSQRVRHDWATHTFTLGSIGFHLSLETKKHVGSLIHLRKQPLWHRFHFWGHMVLTTGKMRKLWEVQWEIFFSFVCLNFLL